VVAGRAVGAAVLGYVAGTLPSADLAARLAARRREAVDLRASGSGNPGAANAIALLGPRWGYGVMAADIAKGAVAAAAGRRVAGGAGAHAAGVAAVLGHCYPAWNGFRGGKGVAASVGQCVATFPAWTLPDLALAGAVAASPWWRRRALAATAASSAAWVAAGVLWWRRSWPNLWGPPPTAALPVAAAASSAVILARFAAAARSPAPPTAVPPPADAALLAQKRSDGERDCAQSASALVGEAP
jgi:glycerol-3-phosphate acyltransferase PlsY